VSGRGRPPAAWTYQPSAAQAHDDEHDLIVVDELHAGDPHASEVQQTIEYSGRAHGL
jgi:hypothetical protein